MSDARTIGAPRVPTLIPILNPVIRRLLGAGLPFGPNVLITVRGRASGRELTFPVAVLSTAAGGTCSHRSARSTGCATSVPPASP